MAQITNLSDFDFGFDGHSCIGLGCDEMAAKVVGSNNGEIIDAEGPETEAQATPLIRFQPCTTIITPHPDQQQQHSTVLASRTDPDSGRRGLGRQTPSRQVTRLSPTPVRRFGSYAIKPDCGTGSPPMAQGYPTTASGFEIHLFRTYFRTSSGAARRTKDPGAVR